MLDRFFEALYQKVLVNIVRQSSKTLVYIEVCSKKGIVEHIHNEFETLVPNEEMIAFIQLYTKESPYSYISMLDPSLVQGAIPTCNKNRISYYQDLSSYEYNCYENKWTFFTIKSDLYALEKTYETVGLDFVFSPFVLLANFFKDKTTLQIALYVLVQEESLSLSVFESGELLYAQHMEIEPFIDNESSPFSQGDEFEVSEMDNVDDELEDIDEGIDLEDIDVDEEIESLEDFGDIEDLDSLEEIEQFADNRDVEEELLESEHELQESDEEHFNEDYQRFSSIEKAVSIFYSDEKYESKFVENIYIADSIGVSSDLKKYLEEEMFLNVYIRNVDIGAEVCELAKEELGL